MNLRNALAALAFTVISSIISVVSAMSPAQDDPCKTYYDSAQTRLKEVFECKTRYLVVSNPNTGRSEVQPQPIGIKHGLYIMYDEAGNQAVTGYFQDDIKTGTWKYFDVKGKLIKTENYENGQLVSQ